MKSTHRGVEGKLLVKNYNSILSNIQALTDPEPSDFVISDTLGDNKITDVEIALDEIKKLLSTDYSEAYVKAKIGNLIFRGDYMPFSVSVRTPGIRISLGGSYNYYNRLLSGILSNWKKYPKRNNSFICTSSYAYGRRWSDTVNVVFPKNGTDVAICPAYDMWKSFTSSGIERMLYFNSDLSILFELMTGKTTEETNDMFKFGSDEEIVEYLKLVDKKIIDNKTPISTLQKLKSECYNKTIFGDMFISIRHPDEKPDNILSYINYILNPSKNDFKLLKIKDYNLRMNQYHELWFSNDALYIDLNYLWENKTDKFFKDLWTT